MHEYQIYKQIISLSATTQPRSDWSRAMKLLVWRLMKLTTKVNEMDKKMHKITEKMKVAERDIKKGKPKAAAKVLKSAEKKNEKLVKIDKTVRDPLIEKCKRSMKKAPAKRRKAK